MTLLILLRQNGGPIVRAANPALETDSAIALGRRKTKTVGVNLETDVAMPLGRVKRKAISPAIETDVALPATRKFPNYRFECPTHEEPMRTTLGGLEHFRLTYARTIYRSGGTFVISRSPEASLLTGRAGVDYFIGGYVYDITPATAAELTAAGFTPTIVPES